MSSETSGDTPPKQLQLSFEALSSAVREMTPVGQKPIPAKPQNFNFLARPHVQTCRICNFGGHRVSNIAHAKGCGCRTALLSTIGFWEEMIRHISVLYSHDERFSKAIGLNEATYEMRQDNSALSGSSFEEIFVNRLTRNYLGFQSHFAAIRPKVEYIFEGDDNARYEAMTKQLNDYLLKGKSLSILFEESIATKEPKSNGTA